MDNRKKIAQLRFKKSNLQFQVQNIEMKIEKLMHKFTEEELATFGFLPCGNPTYFIHKEGDNFTGLYGSFESFHTKRLIFHAYIGDPNTVIIRRAGTAIESPDHLTDFITKAMNRINEFNHTF